jgi:hypothetical protein
MVYPSPHNVGAPNLNLPDPNAEKDEETKSGFFIFWNLCTDSIFFANIWIYIEDLSPEDFDHLLSLNNTVPRYDEMVPFGSVSDLLNGHARRIDFMAYGNTAGWIDPN